MSEFFTYICTRTTNDPFLPARTSSIDHLSRDVSDAFSALAGGRFTVGQLAFFPVQRSVPNHLLCDGREVAQASFPELYSYIGDSEGAPVDPLKFKLPDYLTAFTAAPAAEVETEIQGTVSTPPPAVPPPTSYPEQEDATWGDVESGGKLKNPGSYVP